MKPHDIKRAFELTAEKGDIQSQIIHAEHAKWSIGVQLMSGEWVAASEFYGEPEAVCTASLVVAIKAAKHHRIAVIDAELKELGVDVKPDAKEPEAAPVVEEQPAPEQRQEAA